MSSTSTLEDLAEQISTAARSVSGFLQSGGHPQPSFQRDAPINTLPSSAPMDILVARQSLIEAAFKLYQLTTGPSEYLQRTAVGVGHPPQFAHPGNGDPFSFFCLSFFLLILLSPPNLRVTFASPI